MGVFDNLTPHRRDVKFLKEYSVEDIEKYFYRNSFNEVVTNNQRVVRFIRDKNRDYYENNPWMKASVVKFILGRIFSKIWRDLVMKQSVFELPYNMGALYIKADSRNKQLGIEGYREVKGLDSVHFRPYWDRPKSVRFLEAYNIYWAAGYDDDGAKINMKNIKKHAENLNGEAGRVVFKGHKNKEVEGDYYDQ